MTKTWPFDSELTQKYTRLRQAFISEFLDAIRGQLSLESAIDVGCGVGYFSKFLLDRGLRVVAVDGREENAKEGRRRFPALTFLTKNVEDPDFPLLGTFDLVLSVGLIYHLENPFRAIRNLHAITGKVLILESMCLPGNNPLLALLDEDSVHDQGLNYIAFYPTESCLAKMLYRSGFAFVYSFKQLPLDKQFVDTFSRKRQRTFLTASRVELSFPNLLPVKEPVRLAGGVSDPWATTFSRLRSFFRHRLPSMKASR